TSSPSPHQPRPRNADLAPTLSGVSRAERRDRAIDALEKVGLGSQLFKRPSEMSGGQKQRVAIARAIVNNPDIILADEPTGALDSETGKQIMDLFKVLNRDGTTIIVVTHEAEIASYAGRTIFVRDGMLTSAESVVSQEALTRLVGGGGKNIESSEENMDLN